MKADLKYENTDDTRLTLIISSQSKVENDLLKKFTTDNQDYLYSVKIKTKYYTE